MHKLSSLVIVLATSGVAVAQPAPQDPSAAQTANTDPAKAPEPTPPTNPVAAPTTGAPSTAPAPSAAPTTLAPTTPAGDVKATATEPPKKLAVGTNGLFQPGLLAQGWYQVERAGDQFGVSQFRLRRAEISVKGEILPKQVSYNVMIDAAKVRETTKVTVAGPPDAMGNPTTTTINNPTSAVSALQDFYITGMTKYADLSLGQFKIPVSWEGYNSSGKLVFPERAVISNTFGDKRDLGVRVAKTFEQFGYSAGVFNGSGLDSFDNNTQKDVALRLEYYPVKGLTIAGVTYDSVAHRSLAGTKDRWEGDVRWESGPYLIQAEYIRGQDVAKDNTDAVTAQGYYVTLGYTFADIDTDMHADLQPVVRVGYFDPDTSMNVDPATAGGKDELYHFDVGVNYYLKKHEMKVQAAYERQQFDQAKANNQVIMAAQVFF
jgi:phosphate-selective porin O/P